MRVCGTISWQNASARFWRAFFRYDALRNTTYVFTSHMDYRVTYEHSLATAPDDFIVNVPSQLVSDVPANIPRALLPETIEKLILERSPRIGKIRNLRLI
jgi:hypothetical protein